MGDSREPNFMDYPEADECIQELYNELLDLVIYGQCIEFHRAIKLGYFFEEGKENNDSKADQIEHRTNEVFSKPNSAFINKLRCICPHCTNIVSANGFAHHLEGCMGFGGRNSSRLARAAIASSCKDNVLSDEEQSEEEISDNDNDGGDWKSGDRKTKKKKNKNPRKNKKKSKAGM